MNQEQNNSELNETTTPAQESAPEAETAKPAGDDVPVLIPDEYDTETVDYTPRSAMRSVVAAKGNVEQATPYKRPKLKGKEAIENFFYHHGTKTIIICVVVLLLIIAAIQSIPTKYDYIINIYANAGIGLAACEDITEQLEEYAEDVDGNGKVMINVLTYNRESTTDPYSSLAAYMMLDTEFGGEYNSFLICLDKGHYDYLVANIGEDIFEAYEDYPALISLMESDIISGAVFPEGVERIELFLALLSVPEEYKDDEKLVARHDAARDMLARILEANPELGKTE